LAFSRRSAIIRFGRRESRLTFPMAAHWSTRKRWPRMRAHEPRSCMTGQRNASPRMKSRESAY